MDIIKQNLKELFAIFATVTLKLIQLAIVIAHVHALALVVVVVIAVVAVTVAVTVTVAVAALGGDKMLPPLEIVTRLNDDITLSQIKEIMTYVESLAPKYKKVRHLLSLEKCSEGYGNIISLLQFPESDVITCLMAPISTLTKIQMINKKKNVKIFGTIFSIEDVKALEKVHIPIEALVLYATPNTIPEILTAYKELQKTSLKVDDFVNIKFRIGSVGEISETDLKLLYNFSKELGD